MLCHSVRYFTNTSGSAKHLLVRWSAISRDSEKEIRVAFPQHFQTEVDASMMMADVFRQHYFRAGGACDDRQLYTELMAHSWMPLTTFSDPRPPDPAKVMVTCSWGVTSTTVAKYHASVARLCKSLLRFLIKNTRRIFSF